MVVKGVNLIHLGAWISKAPFHVCLGASWSGGITLGTVCGLGPFSLAQFCCSALSLPPAEHPCSSKPFLHYVPAVKSLSPGSMMETSENVNQVNYFFLLILCVGYLVSATAKLTNIFLNSQVLLK